MIRKSFAAALAASALAAFSTGAQAQDRYIGEIFMVGYNFCPRGTAAADGQLLPISNNTALFSLLGTMYGGDGRTTFGLPDLRGRSAISAGTGPGLSAFTQGQKVGAESHSHSAGSSGGSAATSGGMTTKGTIDLRKTQPASGSASSSRPPQLVTRYCVVLTGIYPSRN